VSAKFRSSHALVVFARSPHRARVPIGVALDGGAQTVRAESDRPLISPSAGEAKRTVTSPSNGSGLTGAGLRHHGIRRTLVGF
jgi:hypothetical protein